MVLDFPASPSDGELFIASNGITYRWNAQFGVWNIELEVSGGGGASIPAGVIWDFAGQVAPTGWYACDGALKSRGDDAALFDAIGTLYGAGDGSTTFALPDCRGRVLAMINPETSGWQTLGTAMGAATHTLALSQIPSHAHALGSAVYVAAGSNYLVPASGPLSFDSAVNGGGGAHNNVQPTLLVNKIIKR